MKDFLDYLKNNTTGVLMLLVILLVGIFLLNRLCKLFQWGRYANAPPQPEQRGLNFVVVDFFVKIINEFRSLLALTLIIIFALTLGYSLYCAGSNIDNISKALQAVMATLGGLVGSIVGYYFGESAVRKATSQNTKQPTGDPVQGDPVAGAGGGNPQPLVDAPQPPAQQ
jgi:hypothetical protein